ncbi:MULTISPECIES: TrkH family potassium uptake protein [unclassified Nitratiruptor]|uniref:TrkH family potassium uptake protein n=1 Tax=unclassified Nitratiruptor TaxID=2624044 RepID=UPI001915F468|nr:MULTISPECIES: TrkH family potassium uptake protein [unclassified Nitratiruptor]BCD61022.1 trk system potassium uptake protein [Nitratiruptor sp. YY08-10]BCD64954.1 trk system potassium uptake protein [Nitratiruptor sp. YY08-14]
MDLRSIKNIAKFLSTIGLVLSLFLAIPSLTGIIYHESIKPYLIFNLIFFLFHYLLFSLLWKHPAQMSIKEGIFAVNLVWILLGIGGGIGLYLTSNVTFAKAFFEAISGFTTTGATIYSDIESLSHTTLMLRSLYHWLGGMGIIVLGVGLLTIINPTGSLTLFKAESTGVTLEKLTPKIKDTAKRLWAVYIALTLLDTLLLYAGGMNLFDAINHAFSTISTGGFSTKNASLGYWENNAFILWVTTFFMFVSGINFIAHLKAFSKDFSGYRSEEVLWYTAIFLILSFALSFVHIFIGHDTTFHAFTHSFFTISSIITTTGFASTDYGQWSAAAIAIIFIPMFIGANAGSTAGGVKVIRYVVLLKNLGAQIKQILHPNAVIGVYIDQKRIGSKVLGSVSGFFFIYFLTTLLLSFYLYAKGYDYLTAMSAAIAVIGNIGPGFGHVGPADNFTIFSEFDKVVLAIFMIIGRLEFYTFIILFSREFWKKF